MVAFAAVFVILSVPVRAARTPRFDAGRVRVVAAGRGDNGVDFRDIRRFVAGSRSSSWTMIVLHAIFPIDPAELEEALDLAEMMVAESNQEPGVINYRAATDIGAGNLLRFFEQYEDAAALETHVESDHFAAFEAALPDLLAGDPDITRFDVDSASDMEL
jgi:quinol monooxygenase YgiN